MQAGLERRAPGVSWGVSLSEWWRHRFYHVDLHLNARLLRSRAAERGLSVLLGSLGAEFEVISPPELLDGIRDWSRRFGRASLTSRGA